MRAIRRLDASALRRALTIGLVALLTAPSAAGDAGAARDSEPFRVPAGRSPLAQPDERFDGPMPYATHASVDTTGDNTQRRYPLERPPTPGTTNGGAIPWHQARHHVGEAVTVRGQVVRTHSTGEVCFLNFTRDYGDAFYIIIFRGAMNAWPEPPETYFSDAVIEVRGTVKRHEGTPQIRVHRPRQIRVRPTDDSNTSATSP